MATHHEFIRPCRGGGQICAGTRPGNGGDRPTPWSCSSRQAGSAIDQQLKHHDDPSSPPPPAPWSGSCGRRTTTASHHRILVVTVTLTQGFRHSGGLVGSSRSKGE